MAFFISIILPAASMTSGMAVPRPSTVIGIVFFVAPIASITVSSDAFPFRPVKRWFGHFVALRSCESTGGERPISEFPWLQYLPFNRHSSIPGSVSLSKLGSSWSVVDH
jgi:hypothetical protein